MRQKKFIVSRRRRLKLMAIEIKGGKCTRCGYNRSPAAMAFHHTDPAAKEIRVTETFNRSWDAVKKELAKCILLCANCHAEVHEELHNSRLALKVRASDC